MGDIGEDSRWHLDKKVPIALLLAILANIFVGIWYAGRMDLILSQYERRIVVLEAQRVSDDRDTAALKERLASTLEGLARDVGYLRQRLEERSR